ncbi:hypothetical protein, partial [Xanthovirga aplysinae]|uniref:hypothetical protein n=1 Tax=Xanthovirga aplysinae TaxID=2529853 RepID=UPI001CA399C5
MSDPTNDPSKECKVTNETNSDVVIMLPTTAQTDNIDTSISVYNQDLEVLTTLEGGQAIAAGQSGTVVLDQNYIDPDTGESTYSLLY